MNPRLPSQIVLLCFAATSVLGISACAGNDLPDAPVITDDHRAKIIAARVSAEAEIRRASKLLKEQRAVEALNLLINRVKRLQTMIYDELILKSQAYDAADLPTARAYGVLIADLQQAEEAIVRLMNDPLNTILNRILLDNPDPRRREEAVNAVDSGANEVFIQFKTGYRQEIVRSFRVRVRTEPNTVVKEKMLSVLRKLSVGPGESALLLP